MVMVVSFHKNGIHDHPSGQRMDARRKQLIKSYVERTALLPGTATRLFIQTSAGNPPL
jgi:hypothetical protein